MPTESALPADVAVIGGGLAGLSTAALLGQGGRRVVLFEKAPTLGGRARTQRRGDALFNLGPHALYRAGAMDKVLAELGVEVKGKRPPVSGFALAGGKAHTMPSGFLSLLTTRLLPPAAKLELAGFLTKLPQVDPTPLAAVGVGEWLGAMLRRPAARAMVQALFRLSTYEDDPGQSAGAAVAQVQLALGAGVLYVDDGWQSLADGIAAKARSAGVEVRAGVAVRAIEHGAAARSLRLDDGSSVACRHVVIAGAPTDVVRLVPTLADGPLGRAAATPAVYMATLDLALRQLPRPDATFAIGVDTPHYFSVHTAAARLAPAGTAVLHAARYGDDGRDPAAVERELEALVDRLQPGWRAVCTERRFLPHLVVANAGVAAARGGLAGRPSVRVQEIDGLWLAGDWVGSEGVLADASGASAARVAHEILAQPAATLAA